MNTLIKIFIFLIGFILVCDRIDPSMIEKPQVPLTPFDTAKVTSKIFLEYFTGHYCGNCPGSTNPAIAGIKSKYGDDRIIIMAIHAGFFSTPNLTPDKLDLRCEDGIRLYNEAGVTSVPIGRINRRFYQGSVLLPPSSWISAVNEIINKPAYFSLTITSNYDTLSRLGIAQIKIQSYVDTADSFIVSAFVLEDSIIGHQLDYNKEPNDVPNYVFNYVLRDELIANDGSSFARNGVISDSVIYKNFPFKLDSKWNEKQCWIAATIIHGKSGEATQSEKHKIIPP